MDVHRASDSNSLLSGKPWWHAVARIRSCLCYVIQQCKLYPPSMSVYDTVMCFVNVFTWWWVQYVIMAPDNQCRFAYSSSTRESKISATLLKNAKYVGVLLH